MTVKCQGGSEDHIVYFVKGAPERLLGECTLVRVSGEDVGMDEGRRQDMAKAVERLCAGGKRVLGVAKGPGSVIINALDQNWFS